MREKEEERGATRCESESVSMFYSCRAFPVSGNNGGHGSPLPALLGLSRSLLKIERDKERAVSGEISLSLSLSLSLFLACSPEKFRSSGFIR